MADPEAPCFGRGRVWKANTANNEKWTARVSIGFLGIYCGFGSEKLSVFNQRRLLTVLGSRCSSIYHTYLCRAFHFKWVTSWLWLLCSVTFLHKVVCTKIVGSKHPVLFLFYSDRSFWPGFFQRSVRLFDELSRLRPIFAASFIAVNWVSDGRRRGACSLQDAKVNLFYVYEIFYFLNLLLIER